jgi:peptidoglycan/LPS O-acetylase OafA/YrhL
MKGFYIRRALRMFPPSLAYIGIIAICSALGWLTLKSLAILSTPSLIQ